MSKTTTAIVVISYNRPKSLARLLNSISNSYFDISNIPLVLSIDFAENNAAIYEVAHNFQWNHGIKQIIKHPQNLGLRNHVLKCGDLTDTYGSIIMLEDDLFVSPNFYKYAITAINFSKNKSYLAGISLYNHPRNVHNNETFSPIDDGYDNYYFQFASSWGQAWSKEQWSQFKYWYFRNQELIPNNQIPKNVTDWSDKSWLKYFTVYLIKTDKYFLYPKLALTTNFSDAGTHVSSDSTSYQAELSFSTVYNVQFSTIEESDSIYDSFYENVKLYEVLNLEDEDLCTDLYGYRPKGKQRYLLTSKIKNFKKLKSYGRLLKPVDANVIKNIEGSDIFLYDTTQIQSNQLKVDVYRRISYNIGHLSIKNSLIIVTKLLVIKIRTIFDFE